jgi:dCMP deaminase
MNKAEIGGYVPVINDGYLSFFDRHPDATINVFDESILSQFEYLRKDIRALPPERAVELLRGIGRETRLLGKKALADFIHQRPAVILPDDDIARELKQQYPDNNVQTEPVFLRWDRDNASSENNVHPDREVRMEGSDPIITALNAESAKSSNWWRRVGAALVDKAGTVRVAHNSSVPTSYTSAIDGDPRIVAKRGQAIETSIDIHAEARLIASLAKDGIATNQHNLVVTTFPCPNCAKLIAESGIRSCYYMEGYAMVDGEDILRQSGVELVRIITNTPPVDPLVSKPYPSS